jgi:hypothetical protein
MTTGIIKGFILTHLANGEIANASGLIRQLFQDNTIQFNKHSEEQSKESHKNLSEFDLRGKDWKKFFKNGFAISQGRLSDEAFSSLSAKIDDLLGDNTKLQEVLDDDLSKKTPAHYLKMLNEEKNVSTDPKKANACPLKSQSKSKL